MKRFLLIPILLAVGNIIYARNTSFNFGLDHVAIPVKNVNTAADFCSNVLKLQEITNCPKLEGVRWFSLGQEKNCTLFLL